MTIEAVLVPAAVGVKVTFSEQVAGVVIGLAVQVLEARLKSPATMMFDITSGFAPTLDRVTVSGALVVFTA